VSAVAVRAVFFDAVGTLLRPAQPVAVTYAAVGARFGSRYSVEEIDVRFRRAFRHEEEVDRAAGHRTDAAREVRRWRSIVGAVLDDVTDTAECFRELFDYYARPSAWRVAVDASLTLRALADRGLLVGIASNFDTRLRGLVAEIPELAPGRHVVISSEVGWKKPAPAFFAEVIRVSSVQADEILFVGDDVENDAVGAEKAGMTAVLVDEGNHQREVRLHRIQHLTEVVSIAVGGRAGENPAASGAGDHFF
jgi:putative hydrolase of the HAD superfamily